MRDEHKIRAAEIFGVPIPEVTKAQRDYAKCLAYAHAYGWRSPLNIPARRHDAHLPTR